MPTLMHLACSEIGDERAGNATDLRESLERSGGGFSRPMLYASCLLGRRRQDERRTKKEEGTEDMQRKDQQERKCGETRKGLQES